MADTPQTRQEYPEIRKHQEFEDFLTILEKGTFKNWLIVANAVGVDRDTIAEWKKHPKAREILQRRINDKIKDMEDAGKRDWRMHEAMLKLLGVQAIDKMDVTSDGEKLEQVVIYKPEKKPEGAK